MSDEPETTTDAKLEATAQATSEATTDAKLEAELEAKTETKAPPSATWRCLGACGQTFEGPETIEAAREAGAPVACPNCASDHVIFAG